jgi:hypothetical protein
MNLHAINLQRQPVAPPEIETEDDARSFVLRGWTGEFFQTRALGEGDLRLWHPDGSYYGRLLPDDDHTDAVASGTVYGPTGLYLADARRGRLRVDPLRRRARAAAHGLGEDEFTAPGNLAAVDRRWPRRG